MALLFLEEKHDHDSTRKELETTSANFKMYIDLVSDYRIQVKELTDDIGDLTSAYDNLLKRHKFMPFVKLGGEVYLDQTFSVNAGLGIKLSDWFLMADVQYPLGVGLSIGRAF
jgi:hypothetical protein